MATISLANFFEKFRVQTYSFGLSESLVSSRDGAGQLLVADLGPRLWGGTVTIPPMSLASYRSVNVALQQIQRAENSFLIYDKAGQAPIKSKTTDNLANAKINVAGNAYSATLITLPANFKITAGDYFSLIHNGVHRLFQVVADVNANASGTATVQLLNPLPNGIVNGTAITLRKATVTARYLPNSMSLGSVTPSHFEGASFQWVQTFKA